MVAAIEDSIPETRRYEVVRQIVRGKNMSEIARSLGVDVSTVYKDYQYVRLNAQDYIDKFTSDIIPVEIMKCLTRVNMVSDECWKMAEKTDDEKVKLQALVEAKKAAIDIVNLITNNKDLVDTVYAMRGGAGKGSENSQPTIDMRDVKKQQRLPGSVVKEFKEAVKRQEEAYESEYREQSEDESTTIEDPFEKAKKPQYVDKFEQEEEEQDG
jgi:hypothetical protein